MNLGRLAADVLLILIAFQPFIGPKNSIKTRLYSNLDF